jgi:methyl-accepting chemotaxis protein
MKIRNKYVIGLLGTSLPLLTAAIFVIAMNLQGGLIKQAEARMVEKANHFGSQVANQLTLSAQHVYSTALAISMLDSKANPKAVNDILDNALTINTDFKASWAVFSSGQTFWREPGRDTVPSGFDYGGLAAYNKARTGGKSVIAEPYTFTDASGKEFYVIDVMTPISRNGRSIGVMGLVMDLGSIQSIAIDAKPIKDSDAALLNSQGVYTVHVDPDMRGRRIADEGHSQKFKDALRAGQAYSERRADKKLKSAVVDVLVPEKINGTAETWLFLLSVPVHELARESGFDKLIGMILGVAAFFVLGITVVVFLLSTCISKPVVEASQHLAHIATGEGDLRLRMVANTKDEIGDLSSNFNQFAETLGGIVSSVRQTGDTLLGLSHEMNLAIRQDEVAVKRIVGTVEKVSEVAQAQATSVEQTSASVEQINSNIERLKAEIEAQASAVKQSSASIEEMLANIKSIAAVVDASSRRFETLIDSAGVGRERLDEVSELVKKISLQSQALDEANTVISNIASQTNLLAMNAAIEAAHAGEAGRGFAVVSDEIRKLAEDSASQSASIGAEVKAITSSIQEVVNSSSAATSAFDNISLLLKEAGESEQSVKLSMVEQSSASSEILLALASINEITDAVKAGSVEMSEGGMAILEETRKLTAVGEQFRRAMEEIREASSEIENSSRAVNELSDKNRYAVREMAEQVGKFKT